MRSIARMTATLALLAVTASPLPAQESAGLMGDLLRDVTDVEKKVVGLARALPQAAYDWRPAKGVRSTGEALIHVAADNYFLPGAMGTPPPADTGINGKDYNTVAAYEKRTMTRDQIIAEVEKSFAFLKKSMADTPEAKLSAPLEAFGQKMTNQRLWVSTVTHLHEHLGQLIAYARSNNVVPPWSKQ